MTKQLDMRERCARIAKRTGRRVDQPHRKLGSTIANWPEVIDAIFAELSEPDEAMKDNGGSEIFWDRENPSARFPSQTAAVVWQAMLKAARGEDG